MGLDLRVLRATHASFVREDVAKLRGRTTAEIAAGCDAALAAIESWFGERKDLIEQGGYGSFQGFHDTYAATLDRFREVLAQSFALDDDDPAQVFARAEGAVRNALPFVEDPRAFALRALVGKPPFEPPGPLARTLLDLRVELATIEDWKQRRFQRSWSTWGRWMWTMEEQAAWILTQLGDAATRHEVALTPFAERLDRLRKAKAAKDARGGASTP